MENLQFPIGKFISPSVITTDMRTAYIRTIEEFPKDLQLALQNISEDQLDTTYRPEGWTVRQVVHHCADSHCNSFIRFKLALTEESPIVKPYREEQWAELADSRILPIASSLQILEGVHYRWTFLLRSMRDTDFGKVFIHPEHGKAFRLDTVLAMYAWHCVHHLAHILLVVKNK